MTEVCEVSLTRGRSDPVVASRRDHCGGRKLKRSSIKPTQREDLKPFSVGNVLLVDRAPSRVCNHPLCVWCGTFVTRPVVLGWDLGVATTQGILVRGPGSQKRLFSGRAWCRWDQTFLKRGGLLDRLVWKTKSREGGSSRPLKV